MDLKIIETGNGGDLAKNGDQIRVINGFQNMPYLAMFGGNHEESTPNSRRPAEKRFDYWGNELLLRSSPEQQFNSLTEKTLKSVSLNSAGRIKILDAVKSDLEFMRAFANVSVDVQIIAQDRVKISVIIQQPDNLESDEFIYIWDATAFELDATGVTFPKKYSYLLTEIGDIITTEDRSEILWE